MTIQRMDHVSVVVDDLEAAIAFFVELGMELEGEEPIEGRWVDRVNGLDGVQVNIAMMRTPDGHGRLELTKFHNPKLVEIDPAMAPPNTLGLRSVLFTVESVDDTASRAFGTHLPRPHRRVGRASAMSSRLVSRPTACRRSSMAGSRYLKSKDKDTTMSELLVDFITSLDGYGSADGWPGFWGLQGPEYLAWLEEQPEVTYLMGANTYRLMSGFAAGETPAGTDEFNADEEASVDGLTRASKVVFSTSLEEPLTWANSTLVRDDAVEAVRTMKAHGSDLISTLGSISLCRSLLRAGLVDRFRVVMFPVITGATGAGRIYDGYPDVALEMINNRTFDGRIQLVEYRPRVLEHAPLAPTA